MVNNKLVGLPATKTSLGLHKIALSDGILKVFGSKVWMEAT
jgi:hypothetical protein